MWLVKITGADPTTLARSKVVGDDFDGAVQMLDKHLSVREDDALRQERDNADRMRHSPAEGQRKAMLADEFEDAISDYDTALKLTNDGDVQDDSVARKSPSATA